MSVTILGIDPSLTNTGLVWGTGPDAHEKQCVGYKPKRGEQFKTVPDRIRRLNILIHELENLLEESISPGYVMIEGYAYSRQRVITQAEFGGMLRSKLLDQTENVIEVTANQLKKFATGKTTGDKNLILLQVYRRWGVECRNDDEADAYVLYRIGLCYAGICEPENQAQREVIEKLKS